MLTPETLRKIRRIELKTRRLVDTAFAGAYHAVFKGRGILFDAVRPYEAGDDVRTIDWKVTARMGEPFVKRYIEERELTVMIVLDLSASLFFGTQVRSKREVAAELGAVLAFSAITNNDKVGLLMFSDQLEGYISPRKGRNHVLRLIRDLLAVEPKQRGTNLQFALQKVSRALSRRTIIFLISDFLVDVESYARDLQVLARKHDVIAVVPSDPLEADFPDVGLVTLEDAETGARVLLDSGVGQWRRDFARLVRTERAARDKVLAQAQVDRIDIPVDGDYVKALSQFFARRSNRLKA